MAVPPQQAPRERNERRVSGVRGTQCYDLLTRLHTRYWLEYGAAFERIAEDPTVRVVVVSSALEKAFSAGVDRAWNRFASSLTTTNAAQYPTSSHPRGTQTPRVAHY
jgi:hypothetical protein